ncbi:MAG: oligosaccharyl transferase, archaeosortase A system-associated [Halobacteriales archaeon]
MDRQDWYSLADDYGPAAGLALVIAFMAWVRSLDAESVFTDAGVYFTSGNDPWYHARIVHLIVNHFPATQRFDPWSYFPYGTGRHSGFGGLFDQLIALVAMILGLGSPSPRLVDTVIAYAPVAFGALTAIPVYVVGKWLMDRWGGLLAAGILSLLGGQFLSRTVVGAADHQSAEAFFGAIAMVGFLYAVRTGYAEKPTVADIQDRNWIVLRRPVVASLLGGAAIGSYLMTWGPGVAFVFTMGVFVLLQQIRDYLNDRPTEYLAIVTAISMFTAGVLTLAYAKNYDLSATGFSLLQPLVVTGIGGGSIVTYGIAQYIDREGYEPRYYPAAVAVVILGVFAVASLVYPPTPGLFESLFNRMYSYGLATSQTGLTVGELQPADLADARRAFSFLFFVAVFGFIVLLARVLSRDRPAELLLVLWSFSSVSGYFTQLRFGYYLAVNVALLSAFVIWWAVKGPLELGEVDAPRDIETYQILGIVLLLVLVVPGNVVAFDNARPNWETAEFLSGADEAWQQELAWMRNNTPEEPLKYNRRFSPPADGDFDYPPGAYGVMSWWDYGHWITFTAQRIPNANPFQQGPRLASAYLQAQSEERANLILEALPSLQNRDEDVDDISNDELRSMIEEQSDQENAEDTRYVVIDDQMAALQGPTRRSSGKFGPIATWTGPGPNSYISTANRSLATIGANGRPQSTGEYGQLAGVNQRYENTMLARLYFQDAQGLEHYRLVHETGRTILFASVAQARQDGLRNIGINAMLNKGRLGLAIQQRDDLFAYDFKQAARVKTFERVEGATLSGQVDPARLNATNATVTVTLPLQTNAGRNFTYRARTTTNAEGEFDLTVPYPTNDAVTPAEGGTDSGVEATGNYTVLVGGNVIQFQGQIVPIGTQARGTADVPESAIYDGSTIEVDVEPVERNQSEGGGSDSTGGNTSENASSLGDPGELGGPGETGTEGDTLGAEDSATAPSVEAPRRVVVEP